MGEFMPTLRETHALRPHRGQTTFQLNVETMEMSYAEVENGKLIMKEGCLYCSALNFKNADKHFSRAIKKVLNKR